MGVGGYRFDVFQFLGEPASFFGGFFQGFAGGGFEGAEGERLGAGTRPGGDIERAVVRAA